MMANSGVNTLRIIRKLRLWTYLWRIMLMTGIEGGRPTHCGWYHSLDSQIDLFGVSLKLRQSSPYCCCFWMCLCGSG